MAREETAVDVVGVVTSVCVAPPRFAFRVSDGGPVVEAPFGPANEAAILAALSRHRSARVRVRGRGSFTSKGQLSRVTRVDDVHVLSNDDLEFDPTAPSILSTIREIMGDVADEDLATIPQSSEIDRTVYGEVAGER